MRNIFRTLSVNYAARNRRTFHFLKELNELFRLLRCYRIFSFVFGSQVINQSAALHVSLHTGVTCMAEIGCWSFETGLASHCTSNSSQWVPALIEFWIVVSIIAAQFRNTVRWTTSSCHSSLGSLKIRKTEQQCNLTLFWKCLSSEVWWRWRRKLKGPQVLIAHLVEQD